MAAQSPVSSVKPRGPGRPFPKGVSGNPEGRPKGARSKLSEDFIAALATDFGEHGAAVIARVRTEDPGSYLRTIAALVPKQIGVEDDSAGPLQIIIRRMGDEA